jgi:Leucine-rich repeat (LRR) protein
MKKCIGLFIALSLGITYSQITRTLEDDSLALVALYNSTDGYNWNPAVNWTSGPITSWDAVYIENNRVVGVHVNGRNLNGTIPAVIGDLDSLNAISLFDNPNLSGAIPTTIGNLKALNYLGIYNTGIGGTIPVEIGQLPRLVYCNLSSNQLTGIIPNEICTLTSLEGLYLFGNRLTGSIPANIGSLTSLTTLALQENQLSGTLPDDICNLTNLIWLHLFGNQLTGSIPSNIGNISALKYLNLNDNQLSGPIPASIGLLTHLKVLGLWNNQLSGSIPAEIGDMDSVEVVSLWNNQTLSGAIPASIGNLNTLKELHLGNNALSDAIPSEIGNLSKLETFNAENNNLSGQIPASIGNLENLVFLNLSNNQLSGNLPVEFWNLTNLKDCILCVNNLTGTLPEQIGNLDSLGYLDLGDNSFSGAMPAAFSTLSKLRIVWIGNNDLSGSLPADIGNLTALEELSLYRNALSGSIPTSIGNCLNLRYLNLSVNQLDGSIPTEVGALLNVEDLFLGENMLSGKIPSSLGNCTKLKNLDLWTNQLTGSIPSEIGSLNQLVHISFAINQLSGDIPASFSTFTQLNDLHISGNDFSGLPDLSSLPLNDFQAQNNRFTFEDIEANIGISGFIYWPQDSVGETKSHVLNAGDNQILDVTVDGNNNHYQWFNGNQAVANATENAYTIVNADANDAGVYTCRITNTVADQLTLWRRYITVSVSGTIPAIPELTLPANNADQVPTNPTFTWKETPGATDYDWQLATDRDFNEMVLQESRWTDNVYSVSGLNEDQTYYWHVRARNSFGVSNWSAVWQFYTVSSLPVPGKTTLLSPVNGAEGQPLTVDLKWNTVENVGVYVLEVADNPSFSPIFKEGNDIANEMFRLDGLSAGQIYYWRVYATNGTGDGPWSDVWHFSTYKQPAIRTGDPTEITPVTVVLNGVVNANGVETTVVFEIGQSTIYDRTVQAEQNPISGSSEMAVSAFVDRLYIGATYHFRLVATSSVGKDSTGDATFTTLTYPDEYVLTLSVPFVSKPEPKDYKPADYRMVGLPGGSNLPVEEFMSGEPEKDWMVAWDNGAAANYFVRFKDSQEFQCKAGRAFWVVSKSPVTSNRSIKTVSLNNEDEAEIEVHSGWNLITNPFATDVSWTYVQQYNDISRPLWAFDGSFAQVNTMVPYRGYYYFNEQGTTILRIPLHAAYVRPLIEEDNLLEWQMKLTLVSDDGSEEKCASLGVAKQAQTELDRFDFRKPRALGNIVGISFIRPEWDIKHRTFARDIRPEIEKVEKWQFEVAATSHGNHQIVFNNIDQIPETQQVFVIDLMHACFQDLREDTVYSFTPAVDHTPFIVVVGDESAVQEQIRKILPQDFALGYNFPNPFNPVTTIPVSVPHDAQVTLKIYNILGQEITTLFRGTLTTGKHYLIWNGSHFASGIYYCRLLTESGKSVTRKFILAK